MKQPTRIDSMGKHLSDHVGELGLDDADESALLAPASAPTPHRPTVVVKVGTSSILRPDTGYLALSTISTLVEILCKMRKDGHRVVLVSSGAVGVGCQRLGIKQRPSGIAELQALAAVGQPHLMRYYDGLFHALHQPIAQVLLTAETLSTRSGYQNSQALLEAKRTLTLTLTLALNPPPQPNPNPIPNPNARRPMRPS